MALGRELLLGVGGGAAVELGGSLPAIMPESSGLHTYYVDSTNGSDANAGTLGSPFKTLTKALSVVVGGDFVYLRANTSQVYRPAPGKLTIGTGNAALTFTEVDGITGPVVRINMVSGGSTTVTVNNNDIFITFATNAKANDIKTAFDAVGAATALASCAVGGTGNSNVSAFVWTSSNLYGSVKDRYRSSGADLNGVISHEFYTSGTVGAGPPATCNPITVETYPSDVATAKAEIQPRAGMSDCTPKNITDSGGLTAAQLLTQGTLTLLQASHWPACGAFTLAGISGTIHYKGKTGNQLTGLHNGGTAISGTVTTSGTASPIPTLTDRYCLLHIQANGGPYVQAHRVRNVKITSSGGNRGVGVWDGGANTSASSYLEYYGVEFTSHFYQPILVGSTATGGFRAYNCWSHHNGVGRQSVASDTSIKPTAQQHGLYIEGGSDHWFINCIAHDNDWGYNFQYRLGTGIVYFAHCVSVHAGHGDGAIFPTGGGGHVFETVNNAVMKNCVVGDHKTYCIQEGSVLVAGTVDHDHCLLWQTGTLNGNHHYYANNGGNGTGTPGTWIDESGGSVTLLTAEPGFVDYTARDLRPTGGSALATQAVDTAYTPDFDFAGNPRTVGTVGAYEL